MVDRHTEEPDPELDRSNLGSRSKKKTRSLINLFPFASLDSPAPLPKHSSSPLYPPSPSLDLSPPLEA